MSGKKANGDFHWLFDFTREFFMFGVYGQNKAIFLSRKAECSK